MGPDLNKARPNPDIPGIVYIKNVVKNPNIIVSDYTYYFDATGSDDFEDHVTNFYSFSSDKLIIGKFCDIATGIEFVMNAANHRMNCVTTYPFYIMGSGWGSAIAPHEKENAGDLPVAKTNEIGHGNGSKAIWIGKTILLCKN